MELATLFGGPICGVYMLTANYNKLDKLEYARSAKLIGSILVLLFLLGSPFLAAVFPDAPQGSRVAYQTFPLLIAWIICKRYHISKDEIVAANLYMFRSNWTVVLVAIIGLVLAIILTAVLAFFVYEVLGAPLPFHFLDLPE